MKHFTFALLLFLSNSLIAQFPCWNEYIYSINFDDGQCQEMLCIDTISNPNNLWEIGAPQKNTFSSPHSSPNVIVTDKLNPYPTNDTSSFMLSHLARMGFDFYHTATIEGYYSVDSDSLNDYGLMELSPNNGLTWYDMINDPALSGSWWSDIPTLTGYSNGWNYFHYNILDVAGTLGIASGDTIQFRFTFISDSIQDDRDGLMFDSFIFEDYVEGLEEIGMNKIASRTFPNPVSSEVSIEFDNPLQASFELRLFDPVGKEILAHTTVGSQFELDLSNLAPGIYTYALQSVERKDGSTGKVIKVK